MKYTFIISLFCSLFLISCSSSDIVKKEDKYLIRPENTPWSLTLPALNFKLQNQINHSGWTSFYTFSDDSSGYQFYIFIQPAYQFKDPESYRNMKLQTAGEISKKYKKLIKTNYKDYAAAEFLLPEAGGKNKDEYVMSAHFVKDNWWVESHISKMSPSIKESENLKKFFDSFEFIPKNNLPTYSKEDSLQAEALYYYNIGNSFFYQKNLELAISYYEKGLTMQEILRKKEKENWYRLYDNLVSAYGLSGNRQKAFDLVKKGLDIDPEYPLFYYNAACYFAETKNVESCIENLHKTIQYKRNSITLIFFPDPHTDPSFDKIRENKLFIDFMKEKWK